MSAQKRSIADAPCRSMESIRGWQGASAVLRFWADNEKTYSVQCSDVVSGGAWTNVTNIGLANVPRRLSVTNNSPGAQNRFYRLVTPAQP